MKGYRLRPINLPILMEPPPQREADDGDYHHHNGAKQPELQGVNGANHRQWG